jgi:hypothetical protein
MSPQRRFVGGAALPEPPALRTSFARPIAIAALAVLVLLGACNRSPNEPAATATPDDPPLELTTGDLETVLLTQSDAGDKWEAAKDAAPSTVLIGGQVGPANIDIATADATSAFTEKEGTGYLSNTLLVVVDEATARAIMGKHDDADARTRWTQERNDGGRSVFKRTGRVANVPSLGDESYSATVTAKVTDAEGNEATRKVEYVAYRIRNLIAFVVTQDARAAVYALRQEAKVTRLVG